MKFLQPFEFTINQFYVNGGPRYELCNNMVGTYSLVLFTQKSCKYCHVIEPVFDKLANLIQGCAFAKMDVDTDSMKIVSMSRNTTTELRHVPYIVLYGGGRPIAAYDIIETAGGIDQRLNEDKLVQFLYNYTVKREQQQQQQQVAPQRMEGVQSGSATTVNSANATSGSGFNSKPAVGGGKHKKFACYLTFNDAYASA